MNRHLNKKRKEMKYLIVVFLIFLNSIVFAQNMETFLFTKYNTDGYEASFSTTPAIHFKGKGYRVFSYNEFLTLYEYSSIPIEITVNVATKSIDKITVQLDKQWLKFKGKLPSVIIRKLEKNFRQNIFLTSLERIGGPDDPSLIKRSFMICIDKKFARKAMRRLK
ncbi:hypothetical protein BKI52_31410 [marine bacterium AO1-C]|nr:hypothetical protein BKI52_31410 [marine bacterium AO1-C]